MLSERIRQARLLAGVTQEALAEALTLAGHPATKAVISKYEMGKSTPKASMLLEMCRILKVESGYFLHEPQTNVAWLAYRKYSNFPSTGQEVVKGYARDVVALQVELCSLLYPDMSNDFPEPMNVMTSTEAETAAQNLRSEWKLDEAPIENLTQTAEQNGVVVVGWDRDAGRFDGLSGWCGEHVPVTVVNTLVDVDRRRFNLAHELGHLLMRTPDELSEQLAHRFAAALLVPAEVAYRELGRKRSSISFAELGTLKRRYGLSIQGWIYRATDLEIITKHYATLLWREINQRGWKKSEPFNYVADEEPVLLKQMIFHAVSEGLITADRVHQALPDFDVDEPISETSEFPSPSELLAMPAAERERWMQRSFELAANEDFEIFEAFGEEEF